MAEALYLVTKSASNDPSATLIDGIHAVLINSDDGGSDAQIITEAETAVQGHGHAIPDGYFDTVSAVGDLTSGPLPDDTDIMIFHPRTTEIVEA